MVQSKRAYLLIVADKTGCSKMITDITTLEGHHLKNRITAMNARLDIWMKS